MKTCAKLFCILPFLTVAPWLTAAPSDFAVSAELGASGQAVDDESGTSASVSVGLSYQIDPHWSVVLNYTDSGEADLATVRDTFAIGDVMYDATLALDNTAVGLFAQYMTERQLEQWSFGGRLGLVRWDTDLNLTLHASPDVGLTILSDTGTDLAAGLVAQYAFTEKWDMTLGLDYVRYSISFEDESTDVTNTRLYIGIKNTF